MHVVAVPLLRENEDLLEEGFSCEDAGAKVEGELCEDNTSDLG